MIIRFLIVPIIFVAATLSGPAAADPAQAAQAFINDFGNRASKALAEKNLPDAELVRRFRTLFHENFDIPFIARSALGRFWARATDDEKVQYVALFADYIVEIYATQFRNYSGQGFSAKSAQVGADGVITVLSDVVKFDGRARKIEWIIADVDGRTKIRDIKNQGVSLVTLYHDQFTSEIVRHNNRIVPLIDALREKTASLRTNTADARSAPSSQTANLKVTIDGVRAKSGTIMMGLYDRSDGFLAAIKRGSTTGLLIDKERVVGVALRAVIGTQSISFSQLPLGRYAVIVDHDENDDGRLDENSWGVPTEGYGFSNNAQGFLSAPSFDAAAVTLYGTDTVLAISLNYRGAPRRRAPR
jgi:uncharacterized protein (DUF2141 family)/ABC-type transporter MlaC component